jgi:hypothetical protein
MDSPDQDDIARSDVLVPDEISFIAIIGLGLRSLENGISFQENSCGAGSKLPP